MQRTSEPNNAMFESSMLYCVGRVRWAILRMFVIGGDCNRMGEGTGRNPALVVVMVVHSELL